MKIITSILVVMAALNGNSQSYKKIPIDTNYFWRQYSTCYRVNPQFHYQVRYFKDTVINGSVYNKYATFGKSYGGPACASFIPAAYLRQDTLARRVSILDDNMQEQPLYDFSKKLGDTLLSYNVSTKVVVTLTVVSIVNGASPVSFWTSDNNLMVEGIGSHFGGLYGHRQPADANYVTEAVVCTGYISPYKMDWTGEVSDYVDCGLTGLEAETKDNQLLIYPNPAREQITIHCVSCENIDVLITNPLGQIIFSGVHANNKFQLDLKGYSDGLYFVRLGTNAGHKYTAKILKK